MIEFGLLKSDFERTIAPTVAALTTYRTSETAAPSMTTRCALSLMGHNCKYALALYITERIASAPPNAPHSI